MNEQPQHYLIQLHGTRENWPADMDARESRIMEAHFVYLRTLSWQGKVLVAGPVLPAAEAPAFGLIVAEVRDEAEARGLAEADPSVRAGVHTYSLRPMRASLLHGRQHFVREAGSRRIEKEMEFPVPRSRVWRAWTTEAGLADFFSPLVRMELRPGGPFEIYFNADGPEGEQGAEGCTVLAWLHEEMLAFSWNAPPEFPKARAMRTQVIVQFEEMTPVRTRLRLVNHGYGEGEEWDALFTYFDQAWGMVLEWLARSFEDGG